MGEPGRLELPRDAGDLCDLLELLLDFFVPKRIISVRVEELHSPGPIRECLLQASFVQLLYHYVLTEDVSRLENTHLQVALPAVLPGTEMLLALLVIANKQWMLLGFVLSVE